MANVGKNIKQIRIKNNMTQEELAESLFVTRQTISNYETGKSNPDIDTIIKVSELFKVDANTVIYGFPLDEHKRRARNWAIGCGIFLVSLFIVDFLLNNILGQFEYYYIFPPPENIIKFSLFPLTYFVCGFYAMHIIGLFTPLKPFNNLAAKIIRIIVLIITLILTFMALYFTTFAICRFMDNYLNFDLYIRWRWFHTFGFFNNVLLKHTYVFSILGALSWLFGLIYKEK